MLTVVARYRAGEGAGDTVATTLREHAEASRQEEGCLGFRVYRSLSAPEWFLIHEEYRDEEAFSAHRTSPHFHRYVEGTILPLLEERIVDRYEELEPL